MYTQFVFQIDNILNFECFTNACTRFVSYHHASYAKTESTTKTSSWEDMTELWNYYYFIDNLCRYKWYKFDITKSFNDFKKISKETYDVLTYKWFLKFTNDIF